MVRELTVRGWANGERAQRYVTEFSVHQAVNELLLRKVPVMGSDGKVSSTRPISGGELLDVISKIKLELPGQSQEFNPAKALVTRPPSRTAKNGTSQTSAITPASARLNRFLSKAGIYNSKNANSAWKWALQHGFKVFAALPENQRAEILNGKLVHSGALVAKAKKSTGSVGGTSVTS